MDSIIDLIASDASPSEISDTIKNALFAKAAENIELLRPEVAATLFGEIDSEYEEGEE
jgi:flagellar motility protein MotE (MotC chaperone)